MKSLRIEVPDELYDRYIKNREDVSEEMAKTDLAFLADAFLNGTLWSKHPEIKEIEAYADKVVADIDKKAYVVTANGWRSSYGAEIYLIGVYYNKELAKKIAEKNEGSVTEIETNKEFPLEKGGGDWGNMGNQHYLGDYYE